MLKKIISIFVVLFISISLINPLSVQAVTQAEIDANLAKINTELTDAQKSLADLSNEKQNLQDQLNSLNDQIEKTKNLSAENQKSLVNISSQMKRNEEDIQKLNDQIRLIIRELQIQTQTSPLEIIISSQNLSDAMSKMMNYMNLQDKASALKTQKKEKEQQLKNSETQELQVKENLTSLVLILKSNEEHLEYLLAETNGSQQKYQELLAQKQSDLDKWKNTVAEKPKPTPQPIPNPSPSPSGDFIYPSDMGTTRTSRCASGHGYPACDFPGYSNPTPPIFASKGGTVTRAATNCANYSIGCNDGYGNFIKINHGDGTETLYAHLFGVFVSQGQSISQGYQIGQMGCSGSSYGTWNPNIGCAGTHLHFEIRINGVAVNPVGYVPMPPCESGNCS